MEIKLSYTPLKLIGGNISESDFDLYIAQPKWGNVAKKMAIEPLEDSMKETDKEKFDFNGFSVKRKMQKKTTTSWQGIYDSLQEFLDVRAKDSRNFEMDGLKCFDGLGYCILTSDLNDTVNEITKRNTSVSKFPQLYWPKKKKTEGYPNQVILPDIDYRKITPHNASIVLSAIRFRKGLETEVVEAFKNASQRWFENQTGYNKDNLPVKDDSPVRRTNIIAGGKPVFVQLVREETPQYKEAIDMLMTEMSDLEAGNPINSYRVRREQKGTYVNIKNLQDRLSLERLREDNLVNVKGRYEIVP